MAARTAAARRNTGRPRGKAFATRFATAAEKRRINERAAGVLSENSGSRQGQGQFGGRGNLAYDSVATRVRRGR